MSSDTRGTVSYVYNKLDLVTVVDRMGFTNSYTYDNVRRLTSATDASGHTTYYNYCTCGALESITDAAGYTNYFTYDNAGRHVETSYPDGYTVYYNYDRLEQMTNTYDNAGEGLTNWFDSQGLLYGSQERARAGASYSTSMTKTESQTVVMPTAVCVSHDLRQPGPAAHPHLPRHKRHGVLHATRRPARGLHEPIRLRHQLRLRPGRPQDERDQRQR